MKRLSIFALLLACICLPLPLRGAADKPMTVVDYFLRLPENFFEGSPAGWLKYLKQPDCGVVDVANGYLRCEGDGAQPEFEVALFRYRDGRPLLAVCSGELEEDDSLILDFFEPGADRKMHDVPRSIFPVGDSRTSAADGGLEYKNWRFEIPRHGKTILVRHRRSGKILHMVTWNGEKFRDDT